jgi:hypothetical protein
VVHVTRLQIMNYEGRKMLLTQLVVQPWINKMEGNVASQRIRPRLLCQFASTLNNADAHQSGMEFFTRRGAPALRSQLKRLLYCTDDDAALISGISGAVAALAPQQCAQLLADSCRAHCKD